MQDHNSKHVNPKKTKLVAFLVRIGFAFSLIISSRLFLGFDLEPKGHTDILTSISMVILIILIIDYIRPVLLRRFTLLAAGLILVIFHITYGLYYRFFNSPLPFDIFRQLRDVTSISGYSFSLMSPTEWIFAVILPISLLVILLKYPLKAGLVPISICLLVTTAGWTCRAGSNVHRKPDSMEAVPDFIHRNLSWNLHLSMDENEFTKILENIESKIPRNLTQYKTVPNKGILLDPLGSDQKDNYENYNIILVLMESVRAYECGFLGANPSFTPNLDRLAKKARVYENFYANGSQTVRAEISILGSVYPNPAGAPTYLVNPEIDLITLPDILKNYGYETLWFSGFTADFHNKRQFLTAHGIDRIYDKDVFPEPNEPIIGWGMNDREMFGHVWDNISDANEPFFAQVTTLSNHVSKNQNYPEDLEVPLIPGNSGFQSYMAGTAYTDLAVAEFVEKILNSHLKNNTIVIVAGDHGLWIFPEDENDPVKNMEIYFRSPLLIWGPPEIITPKPDNTLGSHVDLAPTLMDLLQIKHPNTFLGNSLTRQDIPTDDRYVISFLGNLPFFRKNDTVVFPAYFADALGIIGSYAKAENMTAQMGFDPNPDVIGMSVNGDLLRTDPVDCLSELNDPELLKKYNRIINDISVLTTFSVYRNAYMGQTE